MHHLYLASPNLNTTELAYELRLYSDILESTLSSPEWAEKIGATQVSKLDIKDESRRLA